MTSDPLTVLDAIAADLAAVDAEHGRPPERCASEAKQARAPPPRGDEPLTKRQANWLADELRRVLREVEMGRCS